MVPKIPNLGRTFSIHGSVASAFVPEVSRRPQLSVIHVTDVSNQNPPYGAHQVRWGRGAEVNDLVGQL
jgi:hypothetical protein